MGVGGVPSETSFYGIRWNVTVSVDVGVPLPHTPNNEQNQADAGDDSNQQPPAAPACVVQPPE